MAGTQQRHDTGARSGLDRRQFLGRAGLALGSAMALRPGGAWASPPGLPLGLQLYSVREMVAKDYAGTLKQIGALGYTVVESASELFDHSTEEVSAALRAAGLRLVSAHRSADDLSKDFDGALAKAEALGLQYLICSYPGKDPSAPEAGVGGQAEGFTLRDFRWNAEQFNRWGRLTKAKGIQFGYHNHTVEFAPKEGVVPINEVLRLTDPELVTWEMDCGWVKVGGGDPVAYLRRYPKRISMLHVKDFKTAILPGAAAHPPAAADLGRGVLDYKPIFAAARGTAVRYAFVEQEAFEGPPLEALRVDAEYIKHLNL